MYRYDEQSKKKSFGMRLFDDIFLLLLFLGLVGLCLYIRHEYKFRACWYVSEEKSQQIGCKEFIEAHR